MDTKTSGWLVKLAPFLTSVLEPILGGVLTKYGTAATTAVRSAITKTDNGLAGLVGVYRKWDANHPLVQTALAEAASLIKLTGLKVPDPEALESHVRAAIHDLASAFVTLDETKAAGTDAPSATGGAVQAGTATPVASASAQG